MSGAAKQRLVAIDVGEVSIVDHPANEEPFVVTKSLHPHEALGIEQGILKAAWTTAQINDLPDSSFLYIEPGGKADDEGKRVPRSLRHFPYKDKAGAVDKPHLDNALARIPGSDLPDDVKERLTARAEHILGQYKQQEGSNVSKAAGVTLDPYTATYATLDAMRDCIYSLGDKLRDPSKLDDAKAEIERIRTMLDNAQQFAAMVTKAVTDITEAVTKAAKEPDADDKGKPKGKMPPFMKEKLKTLMETVKGLMADDSEDVHESYKALGDAVTSIAKAGKAQFSKERLAKLHEAFKHLGTMLKEADPAGMETYKDIFTGKPATAQSGGQAASGGGGTTGVNEDEPKPVTPSGGMSANKAGEPNAGAAATAPAWFDSAISNLSKKIDDAVTGTKEVSKRVEAIEKVEAVSKALPHGNSDGQPVQKQESIWKGLV